VPCVTVADLGILRSVEIDDDGVAVARVTPTYSGCPATLAIEIAVETALREAGFEARIERVMSPAWTTDWIGPEAREKLREYGIAPPVEASGDPFAVFSARPSGVPALRLDQHRPRLRIRLDAVQGALPVRGLPRTLRLFQMHLRTSTDGSPPLS
jgi:phenylacetate-CoA oxygenase PaaJ subunit